MDVGHLVKQGKDPALHYFENAGSIINIHLHGVVGGTDHQQIEREAEGFNLAGLLEALQYRDYGGPVVLEQFKPEHLTKSLETIESAWKDVRVG